MKLRPSDAINLSGKTNEQLGRRDLHQSSIGVLLACNRKYELTYLKGLELIETQRPLSLGTAFQKAIEAQDPLIGVWALQGREMCDFCGGQGERQASEDEYLRCDECKGLGYHQIGLSPDEMTQAQHDRLQVDMAIVQGASELYLKQWPGGQGERREFHFRVRLRNPATGAYSRTFDLEGTADGVIANMYDSADLPETVMTVYELIENKLVGQITPQKVQRLPLDRQVAIYRYGIWRATGRPVETVRYRWVRKPQIRQKQNETLEEFCERVIGDYKERPDFYFHEEEPQFAPNDMLRIEAELWQLAEMVRAAERGSIFVRNTSHCSDFGGCPFIPICTGDPDAMSLYRKTT